MCTLLWCQRDLRINDNAALNWAQLRGQPVIAIYIHSPEEDSSWSEGGASRWWLHNSLDKFSKQLNSIGIALHFLRGNSVDVIARLISSLPVSAVSWTSRHEPARRSYEASIQAMLNKHNIKTYIAQDNIISRPDHFLTASKQTPYRVFTPFYNRLRRELEFESCIAPCIETAAHSKPEYTVPGSLLLAELNLLDSTGWHHKLDQYWTAGETTAHERLNNFIDSTLDTYPVSRDVPAIDGTSMLSPHLAFGEISPRQVIHALVPVLDRGKPVSSEAAECFLRQILWREFARYTLWHFPHTTDHSMSPKFHQQFWHKDDELLEAWQRGQTGIAIIDAAMQQLWKTGWMHNRMRMLVASLLTKNLGIDWRDGANWFWDTLVDADLANNTLGWQWAAGCGVDAAPYFRIFNPETQAKRYDPDNHYINRWQTPDLKQNVKPVVELASSRKAALLRYKMLAETSQLSHEQ